jgi:hypothetical protein
MGSVLVFPTVEECLQTFFARTDNVKRDFRFWNVEGLLTQATELLDRCVRDRGAYDSLVAQRETLRLAIESEEAAVTEDEDRVRSGYFVEQLNQLKTRLLYLESVKGEYPDINGNLAEAFDRYPKEGAKHTLSQLMADRRKFWLQTAEYNSTVAAVNYEINLSNADLPRRMRLIEKSRARIESKKHLSQDGRALDFGNQASFICDRIVKDFEEAYLRLFAAAIGFKLLFGAKFDLIEPLTRRGQDGTPKRLDALVDTARQMIAFLARFGQLDQSFLHTLSLAQHEVKNDGSNPKARKFVFELEPSLYAELAFIRFRGVSAMARFASTASSALALEVKAPIHAISLHESVDGKAEPVQVDQSGIPSCKLGRVLDTRLPQATEVGGQVSLANISPLTDITKNSKWSITVTGIETDDLGSLEDILLTLHLTARPLVVPLPPPPPLPRTNRRKSP